MSTKDSPAEKTLLSKTIWDTLKPQTKKKQQSHCHKIKLVKWVQKRRRFLNFFTLGWKLLSEHGR